MDISVIISTHNQAARLRITLGSLAACTLAAGVTWELVLVNNACTDDTDAVAAGHANRLPLKLVHEPRKGLSWGRNAGLAVASAVDHGSTFTLILPALQNTTDEHA